MTEFEQLVAEMAEMQQELLAKAAQPDADDEKIKAAADGDRDDDGESDGDEAADEEQHSEPDGDEDGEGDGDGDEDDEMLGKSFVVTTADGTEALVYDGAAMVKALRDDVTAMRSELEQAKADLAQAREAISGSVSLMKSLHADNAALRERVTELARAGKGRKSVLNVHDRPMAGDEALAKSARPAAGDLMAKALQAQRAGRISGSDVARLEEYVGRGIEPPQSILARIES